MNRIYFLFALCFLLLLLFNVSVVVGGVGQLSSTGVLDWRVLISPFSSALLSAPAIISPKNINSQPQPTAGQQPQPQPQDITPTTP
jgi:hypothetical protein